MFDADEFIGLLGSHHGATAALLEGLFTSGASICVARAPGRLDVMGGIADYSGSLVLQLPTREATCVAAQATEPGGDLHIVSQPAEDDRPARSFTLARGELDRLLAGSYESARERLRGDPGSSWAAYVVGVLVVLARELGATCERGLRVLVSSRVPEAKGVSSSAALEVASLQAIGRVIGIQREGVELAKLCQIAENYVVGAPCGIMDQMTSALGRAGELLALLCQPAEVQGFVAVPGTIGLWGIDSGIRHAVSGSDYTSVRTGAFMGYRIIAELAGLKPAGRDSSGVLRFDDPVWKGYLANLSPEVFERDYAQRLPLTMKGDAFLVQYGGTTDPVTRVDPSHTYAVRQPTAHPVFENARVRRFGEMLASSRAEPSLREMGKLMYGSHASYSDCGLGSDGTDRLVALVREAGPAAGLFGAKITGGGSGGTVAVLGRADAAAEVEKVARRYGQETGHPVHVFSGSSPGACQFGVRVLEGPVAIG
jgi:galactokinase